MQGTKWIIGDPKWNIEGRSVWNAPEGAALHSTAPGQKLPVSPFSWPAASGWLPALDEDGSCGGSAPQSGRSPNAQCDPA